METALVRMLELVFMLADTEKKEKLGPDYILSKEEFREKGGAGPVSTGFLPAGVLLSPLQGQTLKDSELGGRCAWFLSLPPAVASVLKLAPEGQSLPEQGSSCFGHCLVRGSMPLNFT